MEPRLVLFLGILLTSHLAAADSPPATVGAGDGVALPFDREVINRYSLDRLPRSLSIRQGKDVWLGYDLERAKVCKVWQAPAGKPRLISIAFTARSAGTTWFVDLSGEMWQLERRATRLPLAVRYLGCSQRESHFELTWELRHDAGVLKLFERIPRSAATAAERVIRELRVESLAVGESLLFPLSARSAWKPVASGGTAAPALIGPGWHRIALP